MMAAAVLRASLWAQRRGDDDVMVCIHVQDSYTWMNGVLECITACYFSSFIYIGMLISVVHG